MKIAEGKTAGGHAVASSALEGTKPARQVKRFVGQQVGCNAIKYGCDFCCLNGCEGGLGVCNPTF